MREEQVHEAAAALQRQNVLLLGHRGMGKTATLGQIALALPAVSDGAVLVVPCSLDLTTIREQELFYALMTAARDALYPFAAGSHPRLLWSEGATTVYREQEFSADLGLLLAWLQPQLGRRLILVFLLDNADVLDGYEAQQRDAFRRLLVAASGASSSVRLALAAESGPDIVAGFADLFHTVLLAPLHPPAAERLLREGARGLLEWEPEAARAVIARAAGSPARLTNLGRAAGHSALGDNRLCIISSDVP